jgi:hypothetical protein
MLSKQIVSSYIEHMQYVSHYVQQTEQDINSKV